MRPTEIEVRRKQAEVGRLADDLEGAAHNCGRQLVTSAFVAMKRDAVRRSVNELVKAAREDGSALVVGLNVNQYAPDSPEFVTQVINLLASLRADQVAQVYQQLRKWDRALATSALEHDPLPGYPRCPECGQPDNPQGLNEESKTPWSLRGE